MAVASFGIGWRIHSTLYRPQFLCVRKVRYSRSVPAVDSVEKEKIDEDFPSSSQGIRNDNKEIEWKKFNYKELGIKMSSISNATRLVLSALRNKGYDVYLVGGCVRDLILNRTPKDFDVITYAELEEVKKTFPRCEIIGSRFPICHVYLCDTIVEVSSFSTRKVSRFSTGPNKPTKKFDDNFTRPPYCSKPDYMRWRNCVQRDFTINGLMFDTHAKIVYDYTRGVEDIRKAKMRTIKPANTSFVEDCARILRAVRIAARLGFQFDRDMALSIRELSCLVLELDKGRILMEMNYMLAFGSAEASLRLLWRFGLLELLLPFQASYFVSQGFRRRDEGSNMLLSLFSNLDKLVAPDQPCHSSLWIAILAFHKALVDQPRYPLVIVAFSLAVHAGGSLYEAVNIARNNMQPHDTSFYELLEWQELPKLALMDQVLDLAASVRAALCKMTDGYDVSRAMMKYPKAPRSDLVFISQAQSQKVCDIFECVRRGMEKGPVLKWGKKIDYESQASGNLPEIQHMFARIVYDTVYPSKLKTRHG